MPILSNERLSTKAKSTISSDGRIVRMYDVKLLVKADVDYSDYEIGTMLGYLLGTPHPHDPKAMLSDYDITRRPTRAPHCAWDVGLSYSTDAPPLESNSVDPELARIKRNWQTTEQTLYIVRDRNGDPILNAAGDPFDGGIPITMELPTLVYERNELNFNGALMTLYANSLNSDVYSGAEPGTLKLKISAQETFESDFIYWKVRYEMAYFFLGWQPKPMNAGLYQVTGGFHRRCVDRDNRPVMSPVPLTESGEQVPTGSLPNGVNFITVPWFNSLSYSSLGLPQV